MAPWRIVELTALPEFQLRVRFVDGLLGIVDMKDFLHSSIEGTVFECLRDPALFSAAFLEHGAVTWPGEIDLAPDALHHGIKEGAGRYIVHPRQLHAA